MTEIKAVEEKTLTMPDKARAIQVIDDATFTQAGEFLKAVKALRGEVANTFRPLAKKAYDAHKAVLTEQKRIEAPLIDAEGIIKPIMAAYAQEQERKRHDGVNKQAAKDGQRVE